MDAREQHVPAGPNGPAEPTGPGGADGRPLAERLAARAPELVDRVVEQLLAEVPYYRRLPAEVIDVDVRTVARLNLELFARVLRDGRTPAAEDTAAMMRSAARRAEEGVPLAEVIAANYAGARACWETLTDFAEPAELPEVVAVGSRLLDYLGALTTAVTDGYVETSLALTSRDREARGRLLTAVLHGRESQELWEQAGLRPWRERTVLSFRFRAAAHRPGAEGESTGAVEARRRSRDLRERLAEFAGGVTVLDSLSAAGGVALLPGLAGADELARALRPVLDGSWHVAHAHAPRPQDTAEALTAANDTAEAADRLGLPPGLYDLAGLRFEVQITRPGPARTALLDVLAPLDGHRELRHTLRTYLECEGGRRDTAERLHVHVNTIDYRLGRIHTLTGVDPTRRDGWLTLRASMLAHRYVHGS